MLIEDEVDIRLALTRALTDRGHGVRALGTGMAGLHAIVATPPDLVLLDLGLPDVDGTDLLRMLRAVSSVPVIVITARDDEPEIVGVLEAGADDYLVKPFGPDQLNARIRAVLRRSATQGEDQLISVGALRMDPLRRLTWFADQPLSLSRKEFDMLLYLAKRPEEVVSKAALLAEVWNQPYGGSDKTVDVHLSWLRRKLGESASNPRYLHSVRGVGLRLVDPEA
jgi:DNA-binding response OmpR family regulator